MKTFHDIEDALRNYHWMVREISRLREELNSAQPNVTASYGVEASMPKGNGTTDKTLGEVVRRDRRFKTLKKFEKKVMFVEEYSTCIKDDREIAVLNCMLDGMSIVAISQHMGFSERKVYMIKDDIVKKMLKNAENAGFAGILRPNVC